MLKTPENFPYEVFPDPRTGNKAHLLSPAMRKYHHDMTIVDRSIDLSQIYPFHLSCTCGFQRGCYNKNEAFEAGEEHRGFKLEAVEVQN